MSSSLTTAIPDLNYYLEVIDTENSQREADKAIRTFDAYTLGSNEAKVSMAKTGEQHIATHTIIEW